MVEYSGRLDAIYAALSDPTRRAILERLRNGPAKVTTVATDFPLSLPAVSKHIRVLEAAGLVRRDIQGRDHLISLHAEPLREAASWVEHYRSYWQLHADALAAHLEAPRPGAAM